LATKRFIASALPVADKHTLTIGGTWLAGETAVITCNGKDLTYTLGVTVTVASVCTAIAEMWNGDTQTGNGSVSETGDNVPEMAEATAVATSTTVVFTATDAAKALGKPLTITATETSASGTVSMAHTTTGTGPYNWDNIDNWDTGTIPVTGVNEVQEVDLASGTANNGTFTLTFSGQTTAATAWNATAATVQANLEALSTIGAGNVSVSGTDITSTGYTVTFIGDLMAQNVAEMTIDGALLTGAVPVAQVTTTTAGSAGDDVIIDGDYPIYYGFAQSAVLLNSLSIWGLFGQQDGVLGLPERNLDGEEYNEYRPRYLAISAKTVTIRCASSRVKIDFGAFKYQLTAAATGGQDENGYPALLVKGSVAYNVLNLSGNTSAGVAIFGGETAGVKTVKVSGQATAVFGQGVTFGSSNTIDMNGASLELNSTVASLDQLAGATTVYAGGITTTNLRGGSLTYNSTTALTTILVAGNGFLDFSQDPRAKTVTNPIDLYGENCFVNDPEQTVATFVVDLNEGATSSQVNRGPVSRLTYGTPA
jgi:hypothetical protein